ncbi:MAG: nucleotidyltransferase family protein [Pseudomonadales bacterium]|nr:nucleotidyltransferase family protein [Pseudomonadales bacterium]
MKAMLLAAGRGERMGELTERKPKPLLEVAGKPLLWHHLMRLKQVGISDVVINTSYLGEQIRSYIESNRDAGDFGNLNIGCTIEAERLETAGGIMNALPLLGSEPFLVINSDVWTDFPLSELIKPLEGLAHLVLVDNPIHHREGDFLLSDDGEVSAVANHGECKLTFSGVSVMSPALFEGLPEGKAPLAPLLRQAMNQRQVTGEYFAGTWIDVGTPERLQQVSTLINSSGM